MFYELQTIFRIKMFSYMCYNTICSYTVEDTVIQKDKKKKSGANLLYTRAKGV